MQAQPPCRAVQVFGTLGQFGEDFHFDGAQQGLRGPEAKADLHDGVDVGSVVLAWSIRYAPFRRSLESLDSSDNRERDFKEKEPVQPNDMKKRPGDD